MNLHEALKAKIVSFATKVSLAEHLRQSSGRTDLKNAAVIGIGPNCVTIRTPNKKAFTIREQQGECGWRLQDFEVIN